MSLKEYNKKRNFKNTPEPFEKPTKTSGKVEKFLRFVVQEHHSSHLHYDFRLELGGVLVSWAVPKGPSMYPKDKRLAMKVEDHPLSYINFTGTIPKGNYGAGEVTIWDKGLYHSAETTDSELNEKKLKAGLHKGDLKILLMGEKLQGKFALVKIRSEKFGKDNAWLLIKEKDEYAQS